MGIFLFHVTVDDGGDQKTWEYGVNEVGAFEARERMHQYLTGEGVTFSQIEESPPRNVASLANLGLGCVRLVT
jgi:hypothetical protein